MEALEVLLGCLAFNTHTLNEPYAFICTVAHNCNHWINVVQSKR